MPFEFSARSSLGLKYSRGNGRVLSRPVRSWRSPWSSGGCTSCASEQRGTGLAMRQTAAVLLTPPDGRGLRTPRTHHASPLSPEAEPATCQDLLAPRLCYLSGRSPCFFLSTSQVQLSPFPVASDPEQPLEPLLGDSLAGHLAESPLRPRKPGSLCFRLTRALPGGEAPSPATSPGFLTARSQVISRWVPSERSMAPGTAVPQALAVLLQKRKGGL